MIDIRNYRGFARLMIWLAICFGFWPLVLFELLFVYPEYGARGVLVRLRQEVAVCKGATMSEAMELHPL